MLMFNSILNDVLYFFVERINLILMQIFNLDENSYSEI